MRIAEFPQLVSVSKRRAAMSSPMNVLQRDVEALKAAERHWETKAQRPSQPLEKTFTIALAREAGSSGTLVGAEVAKRLNWPVYDQLLVERIAQEMGLRTQ